MKVKNYVYVGNQQYKIIIHVKIIYKYKILKYRYPSSSLIFSTFFIKTTKIDDLTTFQYQLPIGIV